ncbi:uncharacterized protein MONOS_6258 [Monocercomonoides exilis]|uniref:uncharacterized protein n=1 Tax=Monocercomonoides exilis TaxID=2049356 RepID=UPI00355A59EB|nr:hypothetical protein MONOS_6258 [Monocercomonoides exilis]|eukprot:MONOS_6258.1-p1 / transcript=MONOS_6258.1 / gene=MONOS_6258 / organism=Monocercomonoides_exilis_PA203 / gene_product=unspecified product / transcript_product=unspecified product / location=Mono_scaffold00194:79752-80003(+) / protein_length=84 / sequence_SO=supercontig / SO=protein_coding / is_pseudo=false
MAQMISSNQETKKAIQQPSTVPPSTSTPDEKDSIIPINQQSRLPEGHETKKAREEISQPDFIEEPEIVGLNLSTKSTEIPRTI